MEAIWADLTHLSIPPLDLVIRAGVVYLAVLVLLRLAGKRQLGQMGATEFVALLLISNAVQNSMNGGDNSLVGGLLLAVVLIVLSWGISVATYRSNVARRVFEGSPTLLVHRGKVHEKNLARERLTHGDLKALLRQHGVHRLEELENAILEADGTLSITRVSDAAG